MMFSDVGFSASTGVVVLDDIHYANVGQLLKILLY